MQLERLHHVTCVCADAQRTLDFYRELGFTLVKKTVNFDDPHSYHLYFGDDAGSPGTLLTFFEWPRSEPGRLGRGTLESIGIGTPAVDGEQEVEDPDGLRLRLQPAERSELVDVAVIGNVDLYAGLFDEDGPLRFGEPVEQPALIGAGTTHHIAWRVPGDAELQAWLERLTELGLRPTDGAGSQVLPVRLLPDARRHADRDRHRRPGLPRRRAGRVARPGRSRCRRGSSRSARRSSAS